MNNRKLFVIGNGFDIYHGIRSTHGDFRRYLEFNDQDLCEKLREYFDYEDLWSDFEQSLADFDANHLIENATDSLVPYSDDNWSDAYHHDYQNDIDEVVQTLSETLKSRFASWVSQLKIPSSASRKRLRCIDENAIFLTFNYTPTLQSVYAIPDKSVLHIHGKAGGKLSQLILGHAWNPSDRIAIRGRVNLDAEDPRVTEGNQIIDRYFKLTYKHTSKIIKANTSFFKGLISLKEIYVLGHSMSKVDIDYFSQIAKSIHLNAVKWYVSHHGIDGLNRRRDTIHKLGVRMKLVHFSDLKDIGCRETSN